MSHTVEAAGPGAPPGDRTRQRDPRLAARLVSQPGVGPPGARSSGASPKKRVLRTSGAAATARLQPLPPTAAALHRHRGTPAPHAHGNGSNGTGSRGTAVAPLAVAPSTALPPLDPELAAAAGHTLAPRAAATTPPSASDPTSLAYMQSLPLLDLCAHVRRHGDAIGFVYLARRHGRASVLDDAYSLKVVPHSRTSKGEYYTLSAGGVTHVRGARSEFTELARWEHEYRVFQALRRKPLFGNFRLWKGFSTWRRNIVSARVRDRKELLTSQLFVLDGLLRPALLRARELCLDIVEQQLCQIDTQRSYDLATFVDAQRAQVQAVQLQLGGFRASVCDTVFGAVREALVRAGFQDESLELSYTQQAVKRSLCHKLTSFVRVVDMLVVNAMQSLTSESVSLLHSSLDALHAKALLSPAQVAAHEDALAQAEAAATAAAKKGPPPRAMSGSKPPATAAPPPDAKKQEPHNSDPQAPPELLAILPVRGKHLAVRPQHQAEKRPKATFVPAGQPEHVPEPLPILKVDMLLTVEAIVLQPSAAEAVSGFAGLIDLFKTCVIGVEPLIRDEAFAPVTRPAINGRRGEAPAGEATSLGAVFDEDANLARSIAAISSLIAETFAALELHAQGFERFRTMLEANEGVDEETVQGETPTPEFFKDALGRYKSMLREGSAIPSAVEVGFVLVDAEAFKETLLPSPARCLEVIERVLPAKAAALNEHVLRHMDEAVVKLEAEAQSTEDYVTTLTFLQSIPAVMTQMEIDVKNVSEMYELIAQFEIEAQPQDLAEHQTLRSAIIRVRDSVKAAVDAQPAKLEAFCGVLDKDISLLGAEVLRVRTESQAEAILDPAANVEDILAHTKTLNDRMEGFQGRAAMYKSYQKEFNIDVTKFNALEETHAEVRARNNLWQTIHDWEEAIQGWGTANFLELDADDLNNQVQRFTKSVYTLGKSLPPNEVIPMIQVRIEKMRNKLGTIGDLRNPSLRPRHWERVDDIVGRHLEHDDTFTLNLLDELDVWKVGEQLQEVSGGASSEAALETMLKKVEDSWKSTEFPCVAYRDTKDVFILGGLDDIQVLLDDSQVNVSTISGSRHVGPVRQRVDDIQAQLNLFSDTLEEWLNCQRSWLYLESIFSAPDIQRQLPAEAKMFLEVDKSFKEAMRKTAAFPNALRSGCTPGYLAMFKNNNELLDQIQKCLEDYLESKRMVFPRFFFLSNDELLEILSQTRNPLAVQPHMRKCFDGIQRLEFGGTTEKPTNDIFAIRSPEGERIALGKGIKARGNVELWLGSVEDAMVKSLHALTKASLEDYMRRPRTEWVRDHASQVVIAVSQMTWCQQATAALQSEDPVGALREFEDKCKAQLADLAGISRQSIPKLYRKVLGALITIDVHARDIITSMVEAQVSSPTEFEWIRQLRYYWEAEIDDLVVYMSNSRYIYAYEYLGASMRLVITPLTDRCYLCLMGALELNLGGAPAGPAGTGKTETTKDMAKAVATSCVVFNCSEGLDYRMMGKFFSGLAQSGAWCCFDEFNRIDIEVLSVIAQQILTIRNAKVAGVSRFMFEGREIRLIPKCAVFITMNPGYAGRTELPDNLKALFRPFAMMVPDYGLIAEVILFSEGFENPKNLARKMVQMYKLCSEQLSQQDHYDFGMRAVKSVLVMAGSLKRERVGQSEATVLLTALRDSNLPKFLSEDAVLFQAILSDLFPGIDLPEHDYGLLQSAIEAAVAGLGLQTTPKQVKKVIQLYETMVVRHGVMLVGPTGGGKTTAYQVLQRALTALHADGIEHQDYLPVHTFVLNPKAVSMGELYGEVNPATTEWHDGLMATTVRHCVADATTDHKWIVCDGPVDALWIENMNTVLDDNKMLCLANSERIKLTPSMHMLFEVQDLAVASPATVSRCGMVYVDPKDLGWKPFVATWLDNLPRASDELKGFVRELFDGILPSLLYQTRKTLTEAIVQVDMGKVVGLCSLFQELLTGKSSQVDWEQEDSSLRSVVATVFFFATVWCVGGNLVDKDAEAFDALVRSAFGEVRELRLPGAGSVQDYFIDFGQSPPALKTWEAIVPKFRYNAEVPFFEMLVPTVSTVKFSYLLERFLLCGQSVLFTGPTGVGKSVIAADLISRAETEHGIVPVTINFSAQTSARRTQEIIESKLEKKRKNTLGAPRGKRLVFFVDDLNMPKLEEYGAQPPIELLRQFQDFRGFYDREKLFWKDIEDVTLTAACAPPGGGRNPTTPRFLRHFAMLCLPTPDDKSLATIFSQILSGFLGDGFSKPVQRATKGIVDAAVEVYTRMRTDLLPTPAKSHYVFNLRDLSKCIQGVMQADPSTIKESEHIIDLFSHECMRVFHDRLINHEDKSYFNQILAEMSNKHLNKSVNPETFASDPILFGDFMKVGAPPQDRVYERLEKAKVEKVLEEYLDDYNLSSSKEMKLVFFMDAIQHVARIARMVRQPRGNALLVGVGGTGKQSLTRMACHMAGYKCFQIEITRGYGYNEFREDLKLLYEAAGSKGEDTVFLFTDTQIVVEEFLEDINNMLNSGEVPNLIESDEIERFLGPVRSLAKQAGYPETRDGVYQFFVNRVREKLHIVLCMSPVGDAFRSRCRMFPSIVNCCTIDWFTEWPREALLSVSKRFFEFVDLGSDDLKEKISEMCVEIHTSVSSTADRFFEELRRKYYTTPTSYLELINLYTSMLDEKKRALVLQRDRFQTGLNKLLETNELVAKMQGELTALEPVLQQQSADTAKLMENLRVDQGEADKVRATVKAEEADAMQEADATKAISADAQRDLDQALPALEAANKALDALDKKDVQEVKVFAKPPELVQTVMEAVCVLFGRSADWKTSKGLLGEPDFIKNMKSFDKDNVSERTLKKLRPYISNPSFNEEAVAKVSRACTSMCLWVVAVDLYAHVFRTVQPKREKLAAAQAALAETMAALQAKQAALQAVESKIRALKKTFDKSEKAKRELEESMQTTAARLERAGKLQSALGSEQVRWAETVANYDVQINNVVGNVFLAAACVAYFGAFTAQYRRELVGSWVEQCQALGIPVSAGVDIAGVLSNPFQIREWNSFGLPRDQLSTENAVLVTCGRRWPLMIDPQDQANAWVRKMEARNGLKVIKLTEPNFLRTLENAIRIGQPVLLEEVGETLDPSLEPILLKQTFKQGGRLLIRLGDSDIDYDKNFRFYMTTKLSNPHYLPEICIKVTVINFTVTRTGLEDQLLADVVRLERPDLEERRTKLILGINEDKAQLKGIEDKILKLLFNSQGNILDDEVLIETLNSSKATSAVIGTRLEQAERTEASITEAREKYRPVALRGSIVFFVIADLAEVDPMYQYSLAYFKQLFNVCIGEAEASSELERRLGHIIAHCTASIYTNVARGLFEKHKLVFSFMLCAEIMRDRGEIAGEAWGFFLRGAGAAERERPAAPDRAWLGPAAWRAVCDLEASLPAVFDGLGADFAAAPLRVRLADLELAVNTAEPWEGCAAAPAVDWEARLSMFEKLVLLKAVAEERVTEGIVQFVAANLGPAFVESPPVELPTLYRDMTPAVPLIFILSVGSDPMTAFLRFARERGYAERVHAISLGQGQGPVAERLIANARRSGDWVFLQNCHLAKSWMTSMEVVIKRLADPAEAVHPDFRLYLSSAPCTFFPVTVLQNSVKVTNEPPKGLRANIRRAFAEIPAEAFEGHPLGDGWRKLVFGICFFHAVIQERKKFGALGWNIKYEFSNSDRESALANLEIFVAAGAIPWDALFFITGEITYGGRVTDSWDQRCLLTVLRRFFTPACLDEGYTYSDSGTYAPRTLSTLQGYVEYVESFPFTDDPEVFGMHDNANIAFQREETGLLIRTVLDVQPRLQSSKGGKTPDEIVYELAEMIQGKLPPAKFDLDEAKEGLFATDAKGQVDSLSTVLRQESDRFNSLLDVIWASLDNIKKAIRGLVVMSAELEKLYRSFINNQVPDMWAAAAYPSLRPLGSWVKDLVLRLEFIGGWLRSGAPPSFWLSGFFFPQGFLTGTLQNHARKYNLPIDTLTFQFNVLDVYVDQAQGVDPAALPSFTDGVVVHGLFMDAFRWDDEARQVEDSRIGVMHGILPAMHMLPRQDFKPSDNDYIAPLYKTSVRAGMLSTTGHSTNFVVAAHLPSARPQAYWISKGAALLCQLDD